jgi:hypothetical protein
MVAKKANTGMPSDEYRAALSALGMTQNEAGRFFGVHEVTGRRWATEGAPHAVAKMLRLMIALQFTPDYVDKISAAPIGSLRDG